MLRPLPAFLVCLAVRRPAGRHPKGPLPANGWTAARAAAAGWRKKVVRDELDVTAFSSSFPRTS